MSPVISTTNLLNVNKKTKEKTIMKTIEALESRIHTLEQRNPTANKNIINKLKRQIRALQNK